MAKHHMEHMKEEHEHRRHGGEAMEHEREEKREHEKRKEGGRAKHETHSGHREVSDGHELEHRGPHPGHPSDEGRAHHEHDAKGGKTHHRRARGGKADEDGEAKGDDDHGKEQIYNAQGSNEVREADDETPAFSRGGRKKKKSGGMAEGKMAAHRLDRRPRRAAGGMVTKGHNPYSSASSFTQPEMGSPAARGMEGQKVPDTKTD